VGIKGVRRVSGIKERRGGERDWPYIMAVFRRKIRFYVSLFKKTILKNNKCRKIRAASVEEIILFICLSQDPRMVSRLVLSFLEKLCVPKSQTPFAPTEKQLFSFCEACPFNASYN
jgi:hypothetical protein